MEERALEFFGTDGFRGEANGELTVRHAYLIGRHLGWSLRHGDGTAARVAVGKDTRRSCYMLEYALTAGLTASGADALLMHVTTTPSVSYITKTDALDAGVMISASHNPYSDNGIKLIGPDGEKMPDGALRAVEETLRGGDTLPLRTGADIGSAVDYVSGRNRYVGYLISLATHSLRGLRVGLDCANGSAWLIARNVFEALGARLYVTGDKPDGLNINRSCGSTHMENLKELYRAYQPDISFAFDGDADRCLCLDEKGNVVDGDGILYLYATYMKNRGKLEKDAVAVTVMNNLGLRVSLEKEGIRTVVTDVGDRFISLALREHGLLLGGEQSGHIVFRKYAQTGDGILTALKVLQAVLAQKRPLSALTEGLTLYPQITVNVPVTDKDAAAEDPAVLEALEDARKKLGSEGRVLLRKSGTENVMRVMAESANEAECRAAADGVARALKGGRYAV